MWFDISNTCGSVWLNEVGENRETDGDHDKHCVEEGFQLARVKFDRDGKGGSEAPSVWNCSINIWDGLKQKLAWFKKSSLYFENNFPIFLLSGISNTSGFKVRGVLNWVNFLLIKTFSNIFCSTIFRVSSLLSPLNDESVNISNDEGSFQFFPEAEVISSS